MFRVTLLACSVAVSILFLKMFQALERKAKYERKWDFDGRSCFSSDVALNVYSENAMRCLAICSGQRCATMFYNAETKSCTGCYTLYTNAWDLPSSPGSLAYKFNFDCDTNEGRYNTSCYSWTSRMTWSSAKTYCASVDNRFLAVPETPEESFYISSWLGTRIVYEYAYYLGITDTAKEGVWMTIHGEPIGYNEWDYGQPNNFKSLEHCVVVIKNHKWHDNSCESSFFSVCEKDMIAM